MSAVSEFMKRNKPLRKSKLADYQNDIKILLINDYTVAQIHDFLIIEKIEVSRDYLYRYCQKIRSTPILVETEKQEVAMPELKKEIPVQAEALKITNQQKEKKVAVDDDILNYKPAKDTSNMTEEELKIHRQKLNERADATFKKLKEKPDFGKEKVVEDWKPTPMFADN